MPTRFAKMLAQIVRGGLAPRIDEPHMINLALRVAADSMPPLRLLVLRDVADSALRPPDGRGRAAPTSHGKA